MEYAVISFRNNQYIVKPGDKIESLGIKGSVGDTITEAKVLLEKNKGEVKIGTPTLDKTITLKVVSLEKTDKVDIFKYRGKSRYRRHTGHRQPVTILEVMGEAAKAPVAKEKAAASPTKKPRKTAAK